MSRKVDLHNDVKLPLDLLLKVSSLTRLLKVEENYKKDSFICKEVIKICPVFDRITYF